MSKLHPAFRRHGLRRSASAFRPLPRIAGLLAAGALLALGPAARAADPASVIAAERAFAARALEAGIPRSFLDHMADEAVMIAPEPTSAKALYTARLPGKSPAEGGPRLVWWPRWAGLAASGDLGFTTGPAEIDSRRYGYYFTVWKKQPGGAWKWIYDGGVDSDPAADLSADAPVVALAESRVTPLPAARAFQQVKAAEAQLADRALTDLPGAYEAVLDADSRVVGSKAPPAHTPSAVAEEIAGRPPAATFKTLGGEASAAGDLAWTYGEVRWAEGGEPARGHYVRIWQRRPAGWRLVYDQWRKAVPPAPKPQG